MTPPPPPPAPKADLSVSLTDSADPVVLGNTVEYHYSVQNAGPAAATGVMVSTTLPADATADAATGCAADAGVVTCSLGDVPPVAPPRARWSSATPRPAASPSRAS